MSFSSSTPEVSFLSSPFIDIRTFTTLLSRHSKIDRRKAPTFLTSHNFSFAFLFFFLFFPTFICLKVRSKIVLALPFLSLSLLKRGIPVFQGIKESLAFLPFVRPMFLFEFSLAILSLMRRIRESPFNFLSNFSLPLRDRKTDK